MKKSSLLGLSIRLLCCSLFVINVAAAQSKSEEIIINEWADKPMSINGKLDDWADSLRHFNENTGFSYQLRNNRETLFLAIKSTEKQNLNRILARGITFSINTEGKKKAGPTIVFPVLDRIGQTERQAKVPAADQVKHNQQQILSKLTKINVTGFKEILDGAVSLNNTYGISAAANFDGQDKLVVEIAIPLALLEITPDHKQIACLIEINGVKQARASYDPNRNPRSGIYGNQGRTYERRPPINKQNLATGFWIRSTLAKDLNN
jgi:hypothetical protein